MFVVDYVVDCDGGLTCRFVSGISLGWILYCFWLFYLFSIFVVWCVEWLFVVVWGQEVDWGISCYVGFHTVGPAMCRKGMWLDILMETPVANAEICSCMYMRKVSLFQRPIFRMVIGSILLRCIAMAPPARSEWLLTSLGVHPRVYKFVSKAACFRVLLMLSAVTSRQVMYRGCLHLYIGVDSFPPLLIMWWTRRASDLTGLNCVLVHSWWMHWPLTPFFWLGILIVASAAESSVSRLELLGMTWPVEVLKVVSLTVKGRVLVLWERGRVHSPTLSR